ncbi:shikimate dehydrogenase [Vibrio sp. UCD-FRSSP16_10]|uniref:acetyltransferase n=1 Tax=unclassified Vibrio TaxID=2614977 RepID=UPI00080034B0|nr:MULTISPECIES: acetyltransferase [unclassified Vibrio]OBT10104.1 shikimate dehydrogenase [Vibrio sp. UCD-FRSSP16_30]OBT18894.1 shikimate dehydrogenase [Vibrio sp. UCD-FRSSP16_10]
MSDSDETKLPIVIIGGGGHASVLADILQRQNREILAVVCPDEINQRSVFSGILHIKEDVGITRFPPSQICLVNGIGMLPKSNFKQKINEYFLSLGYKFETIISEHALVSPYATIESGAQILPMAIVQAGAVVGSHSIINTAAIIEHDCNIGSYNHIAPKATLCGDVKTEDSAYIGAGAIIIQGLSVGYKAIVGAGVCLTSNLKSNSIAYPAKISIK